MPFIKNGLTALEIAEVNAAEEKHKRRSFPNWYHKHDYEGVFQLLKECINNTTPPSDLVS